MKNVDFHEVQFRLGETPLCEPKTAEDEAKIAPRSPQDGLKTGLKCVRFLKQFFDGHLVLKYLLQTICFRQNTFFGVKNFFDAKQILLMPKMFF